MGITTSTDFNLITQPHVEPFPAWTYALKLNPEYLNDKFSGHSDGIQLITPTTLLRSRIGRFDTDAARWSRGFTSGKHVFEIVFPAAHRGSEASVGVGFKSAPLHSKGRVSLVGHNGMSWGIDLRSKRTFHRNKILGKFPKSQEMISDKFYMYLDLDSNSVGFGSDEKYYGTGISNIQSNGEELYPMVATCLHSSTVCMTYRGTADESTVVILQQPGTSVIVSQTSTFVQPEVPMGPPVGPPMGPPMGPPVGPPVGPPLMPQAPALAVPEPSGYDEPDPNKPAEIFA